MKILVAEDNPIIQKIMLLLLSNAGYEVDIASDGRDAVKQYTEKQDYEFILMDINMPEMDGFEAAQAIRAWEKEHDPVSNIPIIALTAEGEAVREQCLAVGMNDFMQKPFSPEKLEACLLKIGILKHSCI